MKKYRFIALTLVALFLAALPGLALAAVTPDQGAVYTMSGQNMTLTSGGAHFTLAEGQTMTFTYAGKVWTVTAKAATEAYVSVVNGALVFSNAAQLAIVAPLAGGLFGMSAGTTALVGLGAAGAGAGIGAGVSQGGGSNNPSPSPH